MKYVIMEKAKPYKRTRRGKLESVKGHMTYEERKKLYAPWGGRFEEKGTKQFVPTRRSFEDLREVEKRAQLSFPFEKGRGPDKKPRKKRGYIMVRNPNPKGEPFIWVKPAKAKKVQGFIPKKLDYSSGALGTRKDWLD